MIFLSDDEKPKLATVAGVWNGIVLGLVLFWLPICCCVCTLVVTMR